MISEADIITALNKGQINLPPLQLRAVERSRRVRQGTETTQIDAVAELRWGRRSWKFAAEARRLSTPKILQDAIRLIQPAAKAAQLNPLLLVPFLSPANVEMLQKLSVSGIDMCGNGIVIVPGELLIARTGSPNRFPQSVPIRNIYRGSSSLVARVFLANPGYGSVGEVADAIRDLNGAITLSTVSKVLKALESDLIISRESGQIRLLQPDKLLDEIAAGYRPVVIKEKYIGKVAIDERELPARLAQIARSQGSRFVLTGAASSSNYSVAAREPIVAAYCDQSPEQLVRGLAVQSESTDRFPNVELIRTEEPTVYFDPRFQSGIPVASPVQSYLELVVGDKRQRDAAAQVREYILRNMREKTGVTA